MVLCDCRRLAGEPQLLRKGHPKRAFSYARVCCLTAWCTSSFFVCAGCMCLWLTVPSMCMDACKARMCVSLSVCVVASQLSIFIIMLLLYRHSHSGSGACCSPFTLHVCLFWLPVLKGPSVRWRVVSCGPCTMHNSRFMCCCCCGSAVVDWLPCSEAATQCVLDTHKQLCDAAGSHCMVVLASGRVVRWVLFTNHCTK